MTPQRSFTALLLCILLLAFAGPGSALLREPDHIIYGTASTDGELAPPGAVITLALAGDPTTLVSHTLGSDPSEVGLFVLRVPMDSVGERVLGTARTGDAVEILIDGVLAAETVVGNRGTAQLLDADPSDLGATPALSINDVFVVEGDAGTVDAIFTISMTATSEDPVSVDWVTEDGTAVGDLAGSCTGAGDYAADFGSVTINPGDETATLVITVCGEEVEESDETFFVNLLNPTNANILDPQGRGTITDDDTPPTLTINNITVTEPPDVQPPQGPATVMASFRVSLSKVWETPVSFSYITRNGTASAGSDYYSASGTGEIPAGQLQVLIDVEVVGDAEDEDDETFFVDLRDPAPASILDGEGQGTIVDSAQLLIFMETEMNGVAGISSLAAPAALALSPDTDGPGGSPGGEHLYVAARGSGSIVLFDVVADDLVFRQSYSSADFEHSGSRAFVGLGGIEDLALSPDGEHLYAASFSDDSVSVFARDTLTGVLTLLEVEIDGVNDVLDIGDVVNGINGASGVAVSPDGEHVYVVGADDHAVAVFERDHDDLSPDFGKLSFYEVELDGVDDPSDFGGTVDGLNQAADVVVSPEGTSVYVASPGDNAVAVFSRDTSLSSGTRGRLSFIEVQKDGVSGVTGLGGARALTVVSGASVTGTHVYVAGQTDNSIVVFSRAPAGGGLTFAQVLTDGVGQVDGLSGVAALAASRDGAWLYAAGFLGDALAVFERDQDDLSPTFGQLSFTEVKIDGVGGVDGLFGITDIAVSPDDHNVVTSATYDNAATLFVRDLSMPLNPSLLASTTHQAGVWSNIPSVVMQWSNAQDLPNPGGAGVAGYSYLFSTSAGSVPDEILELSHTIDPHGTTSDPMVEGDNHFFNLRTCDHANNCSVATAFGPLMIDLTAPPAATSLISLSHTVGQPSINTSVAMAWNQAVDVGAPPSGLVGASYVFNQSDIPACNQEVDLAPGTTTATSQTLGAGDWYFHLCAGDAAGNWSDIVSAGPFVIIDDGIPPSVVGLSSVSQPQAGQIIDGGTYSNAMTQILATFSKPMFVNTPPNPLDPADATNPDNYRLLRSGVNGILETVDCSLVVGDDLTQTIDWVSFDPAAQTVALHVGGSASLGMGHYGLAVCGGLTDVNGNFFDGDGNGSGGDDQMVEMVVTASGLLQNPNLDQSLNNWSLSHAPETAFSNDDEGMSSSSGSARVTRLVAGPRDIRVFQCVNLTSDPGPYNLGAAIKVVEGAGGDPGELDAHGSVVFSDGLSCGGSVVGVEAVTAVVDDDTGGAWQTVSMLGIPRPAGAQSAEVVFSVKLTVPAEDFPFDAWFDNLLFQAVDSTPPVNPTLVSLTHAPNQWSTVNDIQMRWSGATDGIGGTGMAGYSFVFDVAALTDPNGAVDQGPSTGQSTTSSGVLPDGSHYFHLRACDNAGNCSTSLHRGWYGIDTTPPGVPTGMWSSSHNAGVPDDDTVIVMNWTPAEDPPPGPALVEGYSYSFDSDALGGCGSTVNLSAAAVSVSSAGMVNGTYYFHICAQDDVGLWSAVASSGPFIIDDTLPPTVVFIDTVPKHDDASLSQNESVSEAISQFIFGFSEPMNDPVGHVDRDDITNIGNYRLIEAGVNGVFDTQFALQCQGAAGDDVRVLFDSVIYDGFGQSSPRVDQAKTLALGNYRLAVCGIAGALDLDGVTDINGHRLDGNSDGSPGDNFVLDFSVNSTNFLLNPNFDGDVFAWTRQATPPAVFAYASGDADDLWSSGSVEVVSEVGPGVEHALTQCLNITGDNLQAFGRVQLTKLGSADPEAWIRVDRFDGFGCLGSILRTDQTPAVVGGTGGAFVDLPVLGLPAVPGAQSLVVQYVVTSGAPAPADFVGRFDSLGLGTPAPLFLDDFESGSSSAWSQTVP